MKTGVAYIRVSKERDNMITQDTQLDKIKQYCKLFDIELAYKYIDLDYSGRFDNRPKFQQLFNDIETGKLDKTNFLLVYKLDRIARNTYDFHKYMKILEDHEIDFISVTQNFNTNTPTGRLTRNILADLAQFESEMISERVKDNMMYNATNGNWNGGPVPLGYQLNNDEKGANIIPDNRAKEIKMFYEWYIEPGGSIRKNVHKANNQNIPSSTGTK